MHVLSAECSDVVFHLRDFVGGVDEISAARSDHHVDWDGDGSIVAFDVSDECGEGLEGGCGAAKRLVGAEFDAGGAVGEGDDAGFGVESCYFEGGGHFELWLE